MSADAEETWAQGASTRTSPPTRVKVFRALVTVMILVAVFGGLFPRLADYSEVMPIIIDLSSSQLLLLGVLAIWFLSAYWPVLRTVLPTLRWREAAVNQLSGTAISNTVPAGGAVAVGVNYAMYLSWGFSGERVWAGLLAAGVWDGLLKAGLPLAALVLLAENGGSRIGLAAPIGGAVMLAAFSSALIIVARSERGALVVGRAVGSVVNALRRRLRKEPIDFVARMASFRSTLTDVVRSSWGRLTLFMLLNHLAMFAVFSASLAVVGVESVGFAAALGAFSLARLLSGIPLTPGGVGLVDAGYVGLLILLSTSDAEATIVAGVLLFRALTFFPPIPLGLATWLFWRTNRTWRRPAGSRSGLGPPSR